MDCCKYGEYRAAPHAQYGAGAAASAAAGAGAGAGWDGYGYAPLPYAPYAHAYYGPPAHDPYARYYRYEYPTRATDYHVHHADHIMPMDYGAYALKEARSRRALARREQRAQPVAHLPMAHTPPLECGMNGRAPTYCEPQMWPHYQIPGVPGGGVWSSAGPVNGSWSSTRASCSREPMRYSSDCRLTKGPPSNLQSQACAQDVRTAQYSIFDDPSYGAENGRAIKRTTEYSTREVPLSETNVQPVRERFFEQREPRPSPPEEKRPPIVPLPAFQQAFGSTEIGKFAEAFSRAEAVHDVEDSSNDNFIYESFQDWDASSDLQWTTQSVSREIKCEENY